jgi:hypothetical protein
MPDRCPLVGGRADSMRTSRRGPFVTPTGHQQRFLPPALVAEAAKHCQVIRCCRLMFKRTWFRTAPSRTRSWSPISPTLGVYLGLA